MYGLTSTLRTAVTGLQVAQDGLGAAANNVTNAHTQGYTRKTVQQQAQHILGLGAGVKSVAISRNVDAFIEAQLRVQLGFNGRTATIANYAERVQGLVFGDPSDTKTGLGSALDAFTQAVEVAANNPEKSAQRMGVIGTAQDLFHQLAKADGHVQDLRQDADRRIFSLVQNVNVALQSIHHLNGQIARSQTPGELLDQRDMLVAELARQTEISTYMLDEHRIAIYGPGGQPLLEYTPRVLEYLPAATVTGNTEFGAIKVLAIDPATAKPDPNSAVDFMGTADPNLKGELGGLLHARDRLLPELTGQLGEMGAMVRFALDAAHNDANRLPPPQSVVGTRTDHAGVAAFGGTAYVAVVGANGTELTIALDLAAAGNPAALAAELDAQLGAYGTAGLDPDGRLVIELADPTQGLAFANGSSTITAPDGDGRERNWSFAHYFGLNDFVTQPTANSARLQVRADLVAQPMRLASAMLDVGAAHDNGSRLGGVGDNRGLQLLAAAVDRPIRTQTQGGLPPAELSMRSYVADMVGYQAVIADQSSRAASNDRVLLEELTFRKASVSGVNVDEEMAHLMILQQAYSASARLITIADRLLEELLAIKR